MNESTEGFVIRMATPDDVSVVTGHRYKMSVAMGQDPDQVHKAVYEVGHDEWLRPRIERGEHTRSNP